MQPTEVLMQEHRLIERVLDALEEATIRLDRGEAVRPGFFLDTAGFLVGFADGCHHVKEERVLFEALGTAGLPPGGGPVAVMRAEHEQGRALVRALGEGARRLAGGDPAARKQVVAAARSYVALLRDHIGKEDEVLFPMANQVLSPEGQRQVLHGFERVEREETDEGAHERFHALADRLVEEVGSRRTDPSRRI